MKKILAALITVMSFTACSNGSTAASPAPTETVTKTVTAKPTVTPVPKLKPASRSTIKYDNQSKLKWVRSQNRKVLYRDYETAKFVVAQALENGRLGKPERHVEVRWRLGMTGWGSIAVNNRWEPDMSKPTAFAHVWFRANGSIDYSRGIKALRLDAGPSTRGVIMYDQFMDLVDIAKRVPPYQAALDQFGAKRGKVWMPCVDIPIFGACVSQEGTLNLTASATDLMQLDEAAITALGRSMTILFGPNWRQM